jgi:hypothetical protein
MDKSEDFKKVEKVEIIQANSFIIVMICDNVFNITHWQNALTFFCKNYSVYIY